MVFVTNSPTNGCCLIDGIEFNLVMICHLKSKQKGCSLCDYNDVRYMRHGEGLSS